MHACNEQQMDPTSLYHTHINFAQEKKRWLRLMSVTKQVQQQIS